MSTQAYIFTDRSHITAEHGVVNYTITANPADNSYRYPINPTKVKDYKSGIIYLNPPYITKYDYTLNQLNNIDGKIPGSNADFEDVSVKEDSIPYFDISTVSFSAYGLRPNTLHELYFGDVLLNEKYVTGSDGSSILISNDYGELNGNFIIPNEPGLRFLSGSTTVKIKSEYSRAIGVLNRDIEEIVDTPSIFTNTNQSVYNDSHSSRVLEYIEGTNITADVDLIDLEGPIFDFGSRSDNPGETE